MANVERPQVDQSQFLVSPSQISLKHPLYDAFGHSETEVSAGYLVRLAQRLGGWYPFTYDEIEAVYCEAGHSDGFIFNRLVGSQPVRQLWSGAIWEGGGWIIFENDWYYFTPEFVRRVWVASQS